MGLVFRKGKENGNCCKGESNGKNWRAFRRTGACGLALEAD